MQTIQDRPSYPFLLVLAYSCMGIFFPAAVTQFSMVVDDLSRVMGADTQLIMLADSFRAVCLVCGLFASSFVYKKLGLRSTILLGVTFQVLPQFLIPTAAAIGSLPLLFLLKGLQGLNAVAFPLYISTISLWVPPRALALATSVFNGSFTAGAGVGAWLAGRLIPLFGWQASFYFIGGICLVFAVPAVLITADKPAAPARAAPNGAPSRFRRVLLAPVTLVLVISLLATTWVSQAVTVDMPIYAKSLGYGYADVGSLMLVISVVTVAFSIVGGGVSDFFAGRARDKLKSRVWILSAGYCVTAAAACLLPLFAAGSFWAISVLAALMMIGVSWAQGVFWAIPSEVYREEDRVVAISVCSGASNIVNPIAPLVVGVLLGSQQLWGPAWLICGAVSAVSFAATAALLKAAKK